MDGNDQRECLKVQRQENRVHPRFPVDEDSVLLVAHGVPIKARIADLSLEGCRVCSNDRINVSVRLPVEITFKVNGVAFRFNGVVRWSDGHSQLGIHFVNMIPRRKVELAEVIEEMAARAQPVNPSPAEPAAPEPPSIAEIAPPANPPSKPRDRRAQARHEVDTLATVFLVKAGSALRGRILDLSLSGCRIRTDERFPVGIYTRVETEFHLEGLPFRLGGVIQAIHNRNMVGIRFLDLSERKRRQVLELIDEMEQERVAPLNPEAALADAQNPLDGR